MIEKGIIIFSLICFFSCGKKEKREIPRASSPTVSDAGTSIAFPDAEQMASFTTETVGDDDLNAVFEAPGRIAATVLPSGSGAGRNIILFDNPELSTNYGQILQLQTNINQIQNINIKQKELELERTKDLNAHGSATGQDLLNIETDLSIEKSALNNERSALIEHESQLASAGFSVKTLRNAKKGIAFLICDIPENHIGKIEKGQQARAVFTAFPKDTIPGKVDAIADVLDAQSRMVKVRIELDNSSQKLKTGMYAKVFFGVNQTSLLSIDENALVTIQGRHYVFVKTNNSKFTRKEVHLGAHIGNRVLVYNGLKKGEEVAVEGVLQLKGLSFGY